MSRRALVFIPLVALGVLGLLLSGRAGAQVVGPCTVTIAGRDANGASSPGTAIEAQRDSRIGVAVKSQAQITGQEVFLELAGFRWSVAEGTDSGKGWSDKVDVARYARYGLGVYKVIGESYGPGACTGTAYVKVVGGNPLTTPVGIGAAVATVVGAAGVAASARSSATAPDTPDFSGGSARDFDRWRAMQERQKERDYEELLGHDLAHALLPCCSSALPSAALLTLAYMFAGAGGAAAPGPIRLPRVPFRPRLSFIGIAGAVLMALGIMVLLQQYAVVYPSRTVAVVDLVLGLAVGTGVPSLLRLRVVRRVNRAIAGAERRIGESSA